MNRVLKEFINYVGSNTIGMIATAICILVDYWFIATAMGTDGLAALSLGLPIYAITWGLGIMLGVGGGAKYAEYYSIGDAKRANQAFTMTTIVGVLFFLPLILAGVFLSGGLAQLVGSEGTLLPMVTGYIRLILLFSPGFMIYNIFESFTRNDDSPIAAMISSIIYNVMNIVFDAIFIFGLGLGMNGAALATGAASICALIYLVLYWLYKKDTFKFVKTRLRWKEVLSICVIGLPSFNSEFLYGFIHITFNITFINLAGNVGAAAFGIVASLSALSFYMFQGIGQGIQPLASYYYGVKERGNLKRVLKYALVTCAIFSVLILGVIFAYTDSITSLLNTQQDESLRILANEGAKIYFIAFPFVGITTIAIAFLSVTSAPKVALILSVLQNGVLLIPLILLLSFLFGINGAWSSYAVSEFILVIASIYFIIQAMREKSLKERREIKP